MDAQEVHVIVSTPDSLSKMLDSNELSCDHLTFPGSLESFAGHAITIPSKPSPIMVVLI